jgi:hypothetical protein
MLRITRIDNRAVQRLILEGRLTQSLFAGPKFYWQENRHAHPERRFVVDLDGVVRGDSAGEHARVDEDQARSSGPAAFE